MLMRTGTPSGSTLEMGRGSNHSEHRIQQLEAVVLTELKTAMPTQVEGPNIIYGVEVAPTARAREGSSTWN